MAIARRRFRAAHRTLGEDEAVVALASYEHHNRLAAPIVRRVLGRLVGWRYDASDQARRRLAGELRIVALRPVDPDEPS